MATILRHPVPLDSYDPDRPLNDLIVAQFKHFVEVARKLKPELRVDMPVPAAEDTAGVNKFIAAVTERLMSVKRAPLKLVPKRSPRPVVRDTGLALAAQAEAAAPEDPSAKATTRRKSRKPSK